MRLPRLFLILAALCGAGCERGSSVAIDNPHVRLPAIAGRPAAGYFTLEARGRGALLSVSSPEAGRVEMHETMTGGTMSSMRPLARVELEDGTPVAFVPGGRHLMIFDPRPSRAGTLPLILHFARGEAVAIDAALVAAGAAAPGER